MKKFVKIIQGDLTLFLFNISAEELVDKTEVSIYAKDNPDGYQRPLSTIHVNNIVKFIESEEWPKITSSFILAADRESIQFNDELNQLIICEKMRLVDGQHRAEAFRLLRDKNPEKYEKLKFLELPATLILSKGADDKLSRLYEIQAFLDLNSKGKKVSTDLAIRLRDEIRSVLGIRTTADAMEHISTKVTLKLNEGKEGNVWYKAVNTEPLERSGLISINAFIRSLKKIITSFLYANDIDLDQLMKDEDEMNQFIENFYDFLKNSWIMVEQRWPSAFNNGMIKANKNYVIQKGMGVNSIHLILADLLEKNEIHDIGRVFERELKASSVTSSDWLVGGTFNGLSSQAGYKMISDFVQNKREYDFFS